MFQKILLPIDMSDRHQAALEAVARLAGWSGGEVILLHVIEVIDGMPREEPFYGRLERLARAHLVQLGERLSARGVPVRVDIVFGHRAREIVRHAREAGADLVVFTARPVDPANAGVGLGSLSYAVGIVAPCPVLLVK